MPMTMPQVKRRARTPDRACADGLGQSAISLNRRAVPREAAFWLVGYVFAAVILGTALPAPLYAIYQRQWHFSAGVLTLIFAVTRWRCSLPCCWPARLRTRPGASR